MEKVFVKEFSFAGRTKYKVALPYGLTLEGRMAMAKTVDCIDNLTVTKMGLVFREKEKALRKSRELNNLIRKMNRNAEMYKAIQEGYSVVL